MTLTMSIPMADSVTPGNLPPEPAYLVYVDGLWQTAGPVHAMYPSARLLTMTVLGGTEMADGCDREPGDLDPASAARWLHWRASQTDGFRPVLYASRDNAPAVLAELPPLGMARAGIRVLSAHYGIGEHICSPAACGAAFTADGTQWTSTYTGLNNSKIDMSALDDNFFGTVATMTDLPITICGTYTDNAGNLYAVGTDKDGVLHESKRTAIGVWSTPYAIAGKTGA
jgi:hypothetical protein